jgi:hypothetical protein
LNYTGFSVATILIAATEHIQVLKKRDDLSEAQTFSDSEALRALEVITRKRPDVVALERAFASTTRGAALINRIKADPKLSACEIRIVAHEGGGSRAKGGRSEGAAESAVATVAAPAPVAPLDQRGTRRAPRFRIVDGVEVMVDGNGASLLDLSIVGAQVTSPTILKPNQRVRMSLPQGKGSIRFSAGVVWAAFELVTTGPRYRAGIEFFDAEADVVKKFCDAKKVKG